MSRNYFLSFVTILATLFFVSCKEKPVGNGDSEVVLSMNEVKVDGMGEMNISVAFQIKNPVEGVALSAEVKSGAEWINNLKVTDGNEGYISFDVLRNEENEARSGEISVIYDQANYFIKVSQDAGTPSPIKIDVYDITTTTFTAHISPRDKKMTYFYFLQPQDYAEENGLNDDDEAQYEDDLTFIKNMAAQYASQGYTVDDIWRIWTRQGDTIRLYDGERANRPLQLYAYGVDPENEWARTTEVIRNNFTMGDYPSIDATFDIKVSCDGPEASISVTPSITGPYSVDAYLTDKLDKDEIDYAEYIKSNWLNLVNYYKSQGYSVSQILDEFCSTGNTVYKVSLRAETNYVAAAFAVDPETAIFYSDIALEKFTTGSVKPSDNVIELDVKNITMRSATLIMKPSNSDTYAAAVVETELVKGMDDMGIRTYILDNYALSELSGDIEFEMKNLDPNTEYYFVAFGYYASSPTTQLYKTTFKTLEGSDANFTVSMFVDFYCNIADVENIDESWGGYEDYGDCFAYVNGTCEGAEIVKWYNQFYFYPSDLSDIDLITQDVLGGGVKPIPDIFLFYYGDSYICLAIGEDANGARSPLFIGEPFTLTADGAQADKASDIVDLLNSLYGAPAKAISHSTMKKVENALISSKPIERVTVKRAESTTEEIVASFSKEIKMRPYRK